MRHQYLSNIPLEEAKNALLDRLDAWKSGACEIVPVTEAHGRVLARAAYARICSPHYNASAMDGVAVQAKDTYGASEQTPVRLSPELYTVVDTGDPLPDGCDAVIMVEDLIDAGPDQYDILAAVHPWQNVRQVGEDLCMGDMIAPSGAVLTPALCGALLAGGVTRAPVRRRPLFGIIPTGDEIVPPTENPKKGEIIEFNATVFRGMLAAWDADAKIYPIVPDDQTRIRACVEQALDECDAVLVSAGSSAGRDDYTSSIIASLGEVLVHGVAIKPGKPVVLGVARGKPVVGLPGYPVSAIVVMDELIRDLAYLFAGRPVPRRETIEAVLGARVVSSLKYREFVRVSLGRLGDRLIASPLNRGAGVITSFTKADGVLIVDQDCEGLEAGARVTVRLLSAPDQIENTLVVTGSHDPLIDEVRDLLARSGAPFRVASTHVGSMGAIRAVSQGLAHMGGIHLLDPQTGEYNVSYIRKYFPDGNARAVRGVGRVQGLMVAKGNPLNIRDFPDAARHRYVNRQRGAGTRILCDHLIDRYGLDPAEIDGYANEECTHTAVAALIAAGNADAGLGIWSAAKMYDLDFIPVCTETYEFLVDERYLDDPMVKAFLETLHSDACRARLEAMGGYIPED